MCSSGVRQSPVNLITSAAVEDHNIVTTSLSFSSFFASSYNTSGLAQIELSQSSPQPFLYGGPLGGSHYLYRVTFHAPSEHIIDYLRAPASAQFWLRNADGVPTVMLALLFIDDTTVPHPWLNTVLAAMKTNSKSVDLNPTLDSFPVDQSYYFYAGSETQPPCNESVTWMIMKYPMGATTAQIAGIRSWQGLDKFRPIQATNNRTITLEFSTITMSSNPNTFVAAVVVLALLCIVGGILAVFVSQQSQEVLAKRKKERQAFVDRLRAMRHSDTPQ